MDKPSQLSQEIDLARCRAQWSKCLELTKKLKKLRPEDSGTKKQNAKQEKFHNLTILKKVMEITIQTEIDLIQLLKPERKCSDLIHQKDTINSTLPLPLLGPEKVNHLIHRLDFIQNNQNDMTHTDHWQIQVTNF